MAKIGRNEPCPCGSGKKYKRCCLLQTSSTDRRLAQVTGHVLAERDVRVMSARSRTRVRVGQANLATASHAAISAEATRLEALARSQGLTDENLAAMTGHPVAHVRLAFNPRPLQPYPAHVVHAIATALESAVDLTPTWTLEHGMNFLADRLLSRVGEQTAALIREARTRSDFDALCRRFGGPPSDTPASRRYSLDHLFNMFSVFVSTPGGNERLEAFLPSLADFVNDPSFHVPAQVTN